MAGSEQKRQKKLQKKKDKRKKALDVIKKSDSNIATDFSAGRQVQIAAKSPIHEALMPSNIFGAGIGSVIISRKMGAGYIACSLFLVDVLCLGIKDAFFRVVPEFEYNTMIQQQRQHSDLQPVEPEFLRKLVEDAEKYARDLGFNPHRDYQLAKKIFGDIDVSLCPTNFEFGRDGKPFYSSGPYDTAEKIKKVTDTLTKKCGPDGFHVVVGIGAPFDYEEEFDDEFEDDENDEGDEGDDDIIDIEAEKLP